VTVIAAIILQPRSPAKRALRDLLFTAADTLYEGTFYLDGNERRSHAVIGAQAAFHPLAVDLNAGLLDDIPRLMASLACVDAALNQLGQRKIYTFTLMARRDDAKRRDHVRARKLRRAWPRKLRPRPRVTNGKR